MSEVLRRGIVASQSAEAVKNYPLADAPLEGAPTQTEPNDSRGRGNATIEALLGRLSGRDSDLNLPELDRLSRDCGLSWQRWPDGGSVADEAVRLDFAAAKDDKLSALLLALNLEELR